MIKRQFIFALLLAGAVCLPLASQAQVSISIGDQGYYNRGSYYMDGGYRYDWVPGHWNSKHHWVHGYYARHDRIHTGVGVGVGVGVGGIGIGIHP
jgi:hypothetical protein